MNTRTLLFPLSLLTPACFAPHDPVVVTGDDSGSEDDGTTASETDATTDTPTTSSATTSATATTDSDSAESSEGTPTESSSGDEADPSTGTFPTCGDGNVDDGEECDEGDAIGPDAHCLEGCILNVCGDGQLDPGIEGCDDGEANNVLEVGACAPDCSTVIEEKEIVAGSWVMSGDFGNNPIAFADSTCDPGYAAMFAVPGLRIASATGYAGDGQMDWVLQPYTAYVNAAGDLLWITDDVALLGVRDGASQSLEHNFLEPLYTGTVTITGLALNWTAINSNDCNGWTSSSPDDDGRYGDPSSATNYLNAGQKDCENWSQTSPFIANPTFFYCVEQ